MQDTTYADERAPILRTLTSVSDASALYYMNEKVKKYAEEVKGVRIDHLPFVLKCVIAALRRHPDLNSRVERGVCRTCGFYDIEACGTVIESADSKDVFTIAAELSSGISDVKPTFAILPYGVKGEKYPALIPSVSEVCVLGVSGICDDISLSGGGILNSKTVYSALVFDACYLSEEEVSGFMTDFAMFLENPEISLLDT